MLAEHKAKGETTFSGADAFKLYDTYGFPIDLTIEMVEDAGHERWTRTAFDQLMQEQKTRAREARKALGDLGWAGVEFGKDMPATEFVGYDRDTVEDAKVVALVVEDELAEELMTGVDGIVVLDKTPFYAEMGGQVADHGVITCRRRQVRGDRRPEEQGRQVSCTTARWSPATFKVGETVHRLHRCRAPQGASCRAHSATHLLDAALQKVLGDHVHQAGSLVEPDRLRFDFTHFEAITPEQLAQVDQPGQRRHPGGLSLWYTEVLPIEEAKKKGAMALFGEKYGDVVRVVEMGDVLHGVLRRHPSGQHRQGGSPSASRARSSVASGVRRIEATVGQADAGYHQPQPADAVPRRCRCSRPTPASWRTGWSSR